MPRSFRKEITIDKPPEEVWRILTGFERYGSWNPFIRRIEGLPQLDARLAVRVKLEHLPEVGFRATIDRFSDQSVLGWQAVFLRGWFEAHHWFELHPLASGGTRFVHAETFTGLISAPLLLLLSGSFSNGYDRMNRALRLWAEKKVTLR
jgi:hypothetical protein